MSVQTDQHPSGLTVKAPHLDLRHSAPVQTSSQQNQSNFNLEIVDVAFGGKGVGKVEGKTWFVEGAVPGDVLVVSPISDNGRYGDAAPRSVLHKSPLRTQIPQCPHHLSCGGCQWQEIPYDEQLNWKKKFVESALKRIGKLEQDVAVDVLPSGDTYGYRNRILVRVHLIPQEEGHCPQVKLGYFARGSRNLVPIQNCAIASAAINNFLERFFNLSFLPSKNLCTFRMEIQELPIIEGVRDFSQVMVTVYPSEGQPENFRSVVELIQKIPEVSWCDLVFRTKEASFKVYDKQDSVTYVTKPGLFQQVNLRHNHTLRNLVKEWVLTKKPQSVLDLFCGSANLSLSLIDSLSYLEGLELSRESILCAKFNLSQNQISDEKACYLAGDGEKHLWKCARNNEKFDLVILDPPRQGFFKGVVPLKMVEPQWILYVSCDPSTLARDLSYLCRNGDYRIEKIVALDFFPHTYHIETVVMLEKAKTKI